MNYRTAQFDRAAARYDQLSGVQRRMAERLLDLVPERAVSGATLELGSGTGHLTRLLLGRWPDAHSVVTDSSPVMLDRCREELGRNHPRAEWQRLDAGQWNDDWRRARDRGPYDLVASNALVQWLPDLDAHFCAVTEVLSPSGRYLVSGFGSDHFPELRAIVEGAPFDFDPLPGIDLSVVARIANDHGLRIATSRQEDVRVVYSSAMALLRSLQKMGASRTPRGRRLTPSLLRALVDTYTTRYAVADGVLCTWRPWYALFGRIAQSDT